MVSIYKDRAKLYADVKKKFAWNNNQAKAALDPIVNKVDAVSETVVDTVVENKPKRKRRTKAEMEASRKKTPAKAKKGKK
jgi:hypothetical protein